MKVSLKCCLATLVAFAVIAVQQAQAVQVTFTVIDDSILLTNGSLDDGATSNWGGRDEVILGDINAGDDGRSRVGIMRWDISSLGPITAVNSAKIVGTLKASRGPAPNTQVFRVNRIRQGHGDWVEGTSNGVAEPGVVSMGNRQNANGNDPELPWEEPGARGTTDDIFADALALAAIQMGDTGDVEWDITGATDILGMLNEWRADGAGSAGITIDRNNLSFNRGHQYFFDAIETAGGQPFRLVLDVDVVPEPASFVLGLGALGSTLLLRRRHA